MSLDSSEKVKVNIFDLMPQPGDTPKFQDWLKQCLEQRVKQPYEGYEDKRKPDGTPYTREELIGIARQQVSDVVMFRISRGDPKNKIKGLIRLSTTKMSKPTRSTLVGK